MIDVSLENDRLGNEKFGTSEYALSAHRRPKIRVALRVEVEAVVCVSFVESVERA
jgi:hypothetical protein